MMRLTAGVKKNRINVKIFIHFYVCQYTKNCAKNKINKAVYGIFNNII